MSRLAWIAAAGCAGILLAGLTRFGLEYAPIESVTAYPVEWLPWVGCAALAGCTYLVAWRVRSLWPSALVATFFVLCWIGIWILAGEPSVPGRDTSGNTAVAELIATGGSLPDPRFYGLVYLSFPGEHILLAGLRLIAGLGIYEVLPVLLVVQTLAFALLSFAAISKLIPEPGWVAISTMLVVEANPYSGAMSVMYPGNFALIYLLIGFLALARLVHSADGATTAERLVFILAGLALTIAHLVTAGTLGVVTAVMWLLRRRRPAVTLGMLLISVSLLAAWQLYWAATVFKQWVGTLASTLGDPASIVSFLSIRLTANFGSAIPAWATFAQYVSIALGYGLGTLLALQLFVRRRWMDPGDWYLTAGVGAVAIITIAGTVGQFGTQFYRYFVFAPFFTVPLLVRAITRSRVRVKAVAGVAVALTAAVIAAPSWLAFNKVARSARDYPAERSVGIFLARTYGDGRNVFVHSPTSYGASVVFYLPYARPAQAIRENPASMNEVWNSLSSFASGLEAASEEGQNAVGVYSEARTQITLGHLFGIPVDDMRYREVKDKIDGLTAVFDDGIVGAFLPVSRPHRP